MKKYLSNTIILIHLTICLSAQKQDQIIVKAGTKLIDYIPVQERYLYPEFTPGKVIFRNSIYSEKKLNYNYLAGEIEFIQKSDTLSIANKKDISLIISALDTFYYDKGYIQQIRSGYPKVGLKQFIELKGIQNKDSYGISGSAGSTTSYSSLPVDGSFYRLTANKDMVFKCSTQYYICTKESGFQFFNRKKILELFPENKPVIKDYLKSNKVNFNSKVDLLRLADFLGTL
jgi:hypothetical protein